MGSLKICIPDGAKELSTQGLLCVKTGSRRVMTQNAQLSPFDLFSLDFIFLNVHKYSKKNGGTKFEPVLEELFVFFVRKSTIMGCNHFCRMCVTCGYDPKFTKVPLISLFNVGMCFLRCVFLSKCNTIFKVPYIYIYV